MSALRREVPCRTQRDCVATLARWAIGLGVVLTMLVPLIEAPRRPACLTITKREVAIRTMDAYVAEAFPAWQAARADADSRSLETGYRESAPERFRARRHAHVLPRTLRFDEAR
jgi:hypothetical protein